MSSDSVEELRALAKDAFVRKLSDRLLDDHLLVKWLPVEGATIDESGCCATALPGRAVHCLAGVVCPPVGTSSWRWRFQDCPTNTRRSFIEIGITLEGGDIKDNSISTKLAPPGSQIATASGVCVDGEVLASLDMEKGLFEVKACGDDGPTIDMLVVETEEKSMYSGVGAVRGHLWRPFVQIVHAEGTSVEMKDFQSAGRAEPLLASAISAGRGSAESQGDLKKLLPGSGGQPGPGIGDIQCLLPVDVSAGRGGLYISGGAVATERNLELIGASAMLRMGCSYASLPEPDGVVVKVVRINDDRDADIGVHIDECNEFIEEQIGAGRSILVHCGAGVSRSGAAVVAYLMWSKRLRFKEALETAKRAREWIGPNPSFQKQLKDFEARLADVGHYQV